MKFIIDENGNITALKEGQAKIIVTSQNNQKAEYTQGILPL